MTKVVKFMGYKGPILDGEYFIDNFQSFRREYSRELATTTAPKESEIKQEKMTKEEYREMISGIRAAYKSVNTAVAPSTKSKTSENKY